MGATRFDRVPLALGMAVALASFPLQAGASQTELKRPELSARDSARVVSEARRAQAAFERLRRARLPLTWGGGAVRCDERIGRFCLAHGRGGDDWVAPREDPEVVQGRAVLTDNLAESARILPGDGWIAGQRVRYLVEARRHAEAIEAANACRAETDWCAALAGFAYHYAARAAEADSAYDVALATLEPKERSRWQDLTMILDHRTARAYSRMGTEQRAQFEQRFWRFADPLFMRAGNELRGEHFSRHVWDQLQYRAQSADGISWGFDLREILIRYGWPSGWERTRSAGMSTGPAPIVSHYSSSPRYLFPPPETLIQRGTPGTWDADERGSRTGYTVPLADSLARWLPGLNHQTAVFRRGDSVLVVAAYELPADSVAADASVEAALGLLPMGDGERAGPTVFFADEAGPTGRILGRTAAQPTLLSLEVIVASERRVARARHELNPSPRAAGELALSELLLLGDVPELPETLPDAVTQARPTLRLRAGELAGVYWEVYGVGPEESTELTFSLRLLAGRAGWLQRMAERAGILRAVEPVRLRWREPTRGGAVLSRCVTLEIPNLDPGTYTLELTLELPDRGSVSTRRDIEVVAP